MHLLHVAGSSTRYFSIDTFLSSRANKNHHDNFFTRLGERWYSGTVRRDRIPLDPGLKKRYCPCVCVCVCVCCMYVQLAYVCMYVAIPRQCKRDGSVVTARLKNPAQIL